MNFGQRFFASFIKEDRYRWLLEGLGNTLLITVFAAALGAAVGLLIALVKVRQHASGRPTILSRLCDIYLTVVRGTPVVVQLLIIYFVVLAWSGVSGIVAAVVAFGLNSGAYVAEIIRAGILAVDRGQMEAGRSLGLGYSATMRRIILPQAIKNILPAMFNELITLLKETAVAGYIGIRDLTRAGDLIRARTFDAFLPLLAVAGIYLLIVLLMTTAMNALERRLRRSDHR